MPFPLRYCPRGDEILPRLRRLFVERDQGLILASMGLPSPALAAFARQHPAGHCDYPDPQERLAFWDASLRERVPVEDDALPLAYLSEMDQGLYGGLLGGEVRFICDPDTGWVSSMVPPLLRDWAAFDDLALTPDSLWAQRYLHQLQLFVEGASGKFGLSHFILVNGLNFVYELIGATNTYLALLDRPEMVERALDLAFELNLWVQNTFFAHAPLLEGGTCSNMVQWFPGRILSESVDPFHMASVAYFERWGRRTLERIFAEFDGGVTHIHGNGRHLLEAVSTVKGLKAIYLGDDKGYPPAFDILPEIRKRVGDMPLVVGVGYPDFLSALHTHRLPGGVFYRVSDVPDLDAANRCMEQVRAYQP